MKSKKDIRTFRPSRWWSNVTALRADAGLSEKDLAVYIGKSDNYISNAVRNGGSPNLADALMLADAFDTTIENLAYGAVGLEIRKAQLEAELQKITEELEDAKKDVLKMREVDS